MKKQSNISPFVEHIHCYKIPAATRGVSSSVRNVETIKNTWNITFEVWKAKKSKTGASLPKPVSPGP
jgi:hypothetical protein